MKKIILTLFVIITGMMPVCPELPEGCTVFPRLCHAFRWDRSGGAGEKTDRIQIQKMVVADKENHQQNHTQVLLWHSDTADSDSRRSGISFNSFDNPALMLPIPLYSYIMSYERDSIRLHSEDRDLWEQFAQAFGREIMKKSSDLAFINKAQYYSDENGPSEITGFAIYEDELEEIEYIRRDIAVNTLSHALARTLEQTSLGKRIKDMEKRITDYMKMEYSKNIFDQSGTFYLPGQVSPEISDEDKEYSFSFSSSFHVDSDSLSPELTVRAVGDFHDFLANLLYDFSNNEASLIFENRTLNSLLGAKTALAFIYEDEEFKSECDISFDF
ncbi:MAG: hypothetical protein AB7S75_24880 [Desulfococcaceae bacterium]